MAPDQSKVASINKTPAPQTVKEVCRFLGATGFFRKHIEAYTTIAAPLHLLLRKAAKFFQQFELHTDASSIALGAVLIQRDDQGLPHAIAYYSRKVRDAETRYLAIDCKALAVDEDVQVFDPYGCMDGGSWF